MGLRVKIKCTCWQPILAVMSVQDNASSKQTGPANPEGGGKGVQAMTNDL